MPVPGHPPGKVGALTAEPRPHPLYPCKVYLRKVLLSGEHSRLRSQGGRRLFSHRPGPSTRRLDMIDYAAALNDLSSPPGNHLEALRGNLKGFHSIRVNDQWRIVFRWT